MRDEVIERREHAVIGSFADAIQLCDKFAMRVVHDGLADCELVRPGEYGFVQDFASAVKPLGYQRRWADA
jgi:hypothetical protein